jgi:hypothetical protein
MRKKGVLHRRGGKVMDYSVPGDGGLVSAMVFVFTGFDDIW